MEKAKILVVEDEAIIAREIQLRLKDMGHDVPYIVATGEDAVEKAKEISPDLVLMDIQLPGQIDGIEAAKLIRSKADIPIIYLTAYPDEAIVERSKITAPFGYIIKPVGNRELNRTIELTLHKHRLERQLNESEDRFRNLVETTSDWIWEVDENVIYTYVSPKIRDILGYKPEEVLGKTPFDLMHPEEAIRASGIFKPIAASQESFKNLETINLRKDGRMVILESSGSPFFDMDGIFRGYRGIDRDITERKKAEEELIKHRENLAELVQERTSELWESENRYRTFLQNFQGIAFQGYMNYVPIFFHGAVKEITGYTEEEFIAGKPSWDQVIYPDDVHIFFSEVNEKLRSVPNFSTERVYRIIRKDGQIRWIHENIQNICDNSRKPIYVQGVIYDITERKQMEKALLEIEEREQQRIGYELHDGLGQMLAGISLKSQNLESKLKEKSIPEAEDISRITFLLEKTKEQLRLLMKGMLPVEMNIEGLSAALEELAWNTKEIFNVPCVFRCDMPVQLCNRIKNINLFRIAQEAVANAVKHGRPERIEISLSRENDEFKLTITDDGAGIPEISKETNCLGLKIMNYRAEMIGASLDIQSEIDRGTSITCTFYDTMDEK